MSEINKINEINETVGKVCMFTGHRSINGRHMAMLSARLDVELDRLIADGYTEFRTGGAVGFDTVAALAVLEKRKKCDKVHLHLYLPCRGQEKNWSENMKKAYYYVLGKADSIRYACESYVTGCMQMRNRAMVEGSNICVAYCDPERKGGSSYTMEYAGRHGVEVLNLFNGT